MLTDLHIRNLAVVEEATIELGRGFNVLSGETGAGKSIVVDSLALLAGVRASSDQIRTGTDALVVTGIFHPAGSEWRALLDEAGIAPSAGDGQADQAAPTELVVRREIARSGRNRVYVDDQPVTLKLLVRLAPHLLRIHGQREELGLVDPELQRTWLDRCGGAEAEALAARVAETYGRWRQLADRLARSTGDDRLRQERIDFLRFVVAEIDGAALGVGEEDELRREREVLRHAGAIRQGLSEAAERLYGGDEAAYDGIASALQSLRQISAWDSTAETWISELEEIEVRLADLEPTLGRRAEQVEADPRRLDELEDRLVVLERLFRKYGESSAAVLEERQRLGDELAELEDAEIGQDELVEQVGTALAAYRVEADELSSARRRWARRLETQVGGHLADLALDKARFRVSLEPRRLASSPLLVGGEAVDFGALGYDQVTYQFSPNPGEELRPLAKVASGGELSRLYLAVQLSSRGDAGRSAPVTLVFDEVDAGISGAEAAVLGEKVRRLADGGQILAVTHLPQVASHADHHYRVEKAVDGGRTRTRVRHLDEQGRVEEVARMLAGSEVTSLSLDHARELIAGAGPDAGRPAGLPARISSESGKAADDGVGEPAKPRPASAG